MKHLSILFLSSLFIGCSQNKYSFKYSFCYREIKHRVDTLSILNNSGILLKTTDLWGNPIPFVNISINGDNLDTAYTDINGKTIIKIPAGKYTMKAQSPSHFSIYYRYNLKQD